MRAGKYWVGDLCYIFGDEEWNFICDFLGRENKPRVGVFTLNGHEGAIFCTKYGDGLYTDNRENEYGVDSGTLGLYPVEGVSAAKSKSLSFHGGCVIDFKEDFEVSCVNGEMRFGDIIIPTDWEEIEEDEEEDA